MVDLKKLLMLLISSEVCGFAYDFSEFKDITDDELEGLYNISKKHDIVGIIGSALIKYKLIPDGEITEKFKKQIYTSIYRYESINYEYARLCNTLNETGIPYLPLKGNTIRPLYPEPWMRTSSDIDLLIHSGNIEKTVGILCSVLKYKTAKKEDSSNQKSLYSEGNVHIELHFDLSESDGVGEAGTLLNQIWNYASVKENTQMYLLSDDMFYYYHIAHMVKHFIGGGCGVRPFIDLWLINHKVEFNKTKREELLREGGLLQFAQKAEKLSEIWFSGAESDALTEQMQDYILYGGVYGNVSNNVKVAQAQKGNALSALLYRTFIKYDEMKTVYPKINGRRWLLPLYQLKRWFDIFFSRERRTRGINKIKANLTMTESTRDRVKNMLKELHLL